MIKKMMLLSALLSALACSARANDIEPGKETYTATRAGGAITIDGNLSEWAGVPVLSDPRFSVPKGSGDNGTLVLFEEYQGGTWTGPDDQTSAVQVVWDDENVYFGFVVTDDYHENSRNSAWNGDSIQLMIANAARNQQVALYNYALGGIEDALGDVIVQHEAPVPPLGETIAVVSRNSVTKKTIYEIKLPKATLGLTTLAAGTQFGLGMAINDGDDGPGQDGQKGWGGLGAHSIVFGKTPQETALVTLSAEGPTVDRLFFSAINPTINSFSFRATDKGASIVDPNTARLTIDGEVVPLTASAKTADFVDFSYKRATPFPAGSNHTYEIQVKDTLGNTVTTTGSFKTINYGTIPASMAVTGVDKTKPGFQVRIWQVDRGLPNTNERSEQELFGELGENVADLTFADPITGVFIDEDVINYDQNGVDRGFFPFDEFIPGIPGFTGSTDNFAAEFLTFIEFPTAGLYTMIVNSDDGFRTSVSRNPKDRFQVDSIMLGEFSGGRGSADTSFTFVIETPGIYPFRTTWEEGGVDANIEWSYVRENGERVLINDLTNPNALKAYRVGPMIDRAYIASVKPGAGITDAKPDSIIEIVVVDANTKFVSGTATLSVDGVAVIPTVNTAAGRTTISHTPASPLTPGRHTVSVSYQENTNPATTRTADFNFIVAVTPGDLPSNSFVIEAEDFDFDGGQTKPEASVMPYFGGAYQDLGAIKGIDFMNNDDVVGQGGDLYRLEADPDPEGNDPDGLNEVAIAESLGGRWGRERPGYEVTVNHRIGWVEDNSWQNYTRTIPAGIYTAYAALSFDGTDPNQLRGSLDLVTSGVGTPNQTTSRLGTFNQNGSGGWGANDIVPMGSAGARSFFKLPGGKVTLRFNLGSGDFDWFALVPVAGVPPSVKSAQPADGEVGAVLNDITVVVEDFSTQLVPGSVKLSVDGQDVTAQTTVTKNADMTTIKHQPSFTANSTHTYTVTGLDSANKPFSFTSTFTTFPVGGNVFVIEAEDFNFDGGKTKAEASVMPYFGGAYNGLGATENVDFLNGDGNDSDVYRTEKPDTGDIENEVNIVDNIGGQLGRSRGQWYVTSNYRIGWVGTGEWQNYTRTIPNGNYEVYAALSFDGRAASQLSGSLQLVTSPADAPDQTVEDLGVFDAPGSGGWGRNDLVVMTDVVGGTKKVVQLGGTQTLRYNMASGDFDYLVLVPADSARPQITSISQAAGTVRIEWTGGGTLEVSDSVSGPWTDTGLSSPANVPIDRAARFGRVKR
jgi:hypothetical protein